MKSIVIIYIFDGISKLPNLFKQLYLLLYKKIVVAQILPAIIIHLKEMEKTKNNEIQNTNNNPICIF